MKVLIVGATGFIGRAVVLRLRRDGHEVTAWVRSPERARALLGQEASLIDASAGAGALRLALVAADAVVNLAGEPILPGRWTERRRASLAASRIGVTDQIVQAMAELPIRPRVLVSSSAVGFYGDRPGEALDEESARGQGFLAELCESWEASASRASKLGVRVAVLRTGIVLGRGGGFLGSVAPLFRAGLGGPLGSGKQQVPWIHLDDLVELIVEALLDPRFTGPINATAPDSVSFRELAHTLAAALGRRPGPRVPAALLRVALGSASSALLASQRVLPAKARELGFRWAFSDLAQALEDAVSTAGVRIERAPDATPALRDAGGYLARRQPTYLLTSTTKLAAPLERVFDFFSRPENLGAMTPASLSFRIVGEPPPMQAGARIDYRIRLGALPMVWRSSIERHRPPHAFVDAQLRGPYRTWWHEHRFSSVDGHTIMEDRVYYALPFGWLGRLVHRLFVASTLRAIFAFRLQAVRLRFGTGACPSGERLAQRGAA